MSLSFIFRLILNWLIILLVERWFFCQNFLGFNLHINWILYICPYRLGKSWTNWIEAWLITITFSCDKTLWNHTQWQICRFSDVCERIIMITDYRDVIITTFMYWIVWCWWLEAGLDVFTLSYAKSWAYYFWNRLLTTFTTLDRRLLHWWLL